MRDRRNWGGGTAQALFGLALLAGLGAWNYHRNWQLEIDADGGRPYSSYSRPGVEALRDAHRTELVGARSRFEAARQARVRPQLEVGSLAQHIDQFSRTAAQSEGIRSAAAAVSRQEQEIARLERELDRRNRAGFSHHLQRLLAF